MDLSTHYLGLHLAHPLMPGASPLSEDLDAVKRLEDAGASAIVMRSLFEEQITGDALAVQRHFDRHGSAHAEAASYAPEIAFRLGPDAYLEQIRKIREAVAVPVIASLNGVTPGGWLDHALLMQQAGAHALELNLYSLPTSADEDGATVERRSLSIVEAVTSAVKIPVAVKLSPFYSSLPHFTRKLEEAGAKGAVLFNRFYQPDIDPEALDVRRTLRLSDSSELLLRLRWLAILSWQTRLTLAVSGGVHEPVDAIKAMMAGARAVQTVSSLLKRGPGHLKVLIDGVRRWLEEHEYVSVQQLTGSMSLAKSPDPAAYERGNYVEILEGWHPEDG
jgi:dihydroorotate dehydrogenase (fumarate)